MLTKSTDPVKVREFFKVKIDLKTPKVITDLSKRHKMLLWGRFALYESFLVIVSYWSISCHRQWTVILTPSC